MYKLRIIDRYTKVTTTFLAIDLPEEEVKRIVEHWEKNLKNLVTFNEYFSVAYPHVKALDLLDVTPNQVVYSA